MRLQRILRWIIKRNNKHKTHKEHFQLTYLIARQPTTWSRKKARATMPHKHVRDTWPRVNDQNQIQTFRHCRNIEIRWERERLCVRVCVCDRERRDRNACKVWKLKRKSSHKIISLHKRMERHNDFSVIFPKRKLNRKRKEKHLLIKEFQHLIFVAFTPGAAKHVWSFFYIIHTYTV